MCIHLHITFSFFSGEEEYNCVWFESRGPNIMEFQIGLRPSTTPSFELCDNSHFLQRTWNTQARELMMQYIPYMFVKKLGIIYSVTYIANRKHV